MAVQGVPTRKSEAESGYWLITHVGYRGDTDQSHRGDPKKYQPGKWRLILDLSHPENKSVNNGIKPELCSLSYVSVDDEVRMAMEHGPGALMAKLDIQSAYRMIPVHPGDRRLLGMSWGGHLYVYTVLQFGFPHNIYCSCRCPAVDTRDARGEICHALS